jgi:DNA-binding NtrC family response regulator
MVLLVDDERTIADTLAIVLESKGFGTTVAYCGEDALEIAKTLKPDVLLSDVILGGMNGIDLAVEIRKIQPDCRVILYSGDFLTTELLDDAKTRGHHFEILAKPVHPQVFLDLLAPQLAKEVDKFLV